MGGCSKLDSSEPRRQPADDSVTTVNPRPPCLVQPARHRAYVLYRVLPQVPHVLCGFRSPNVCCLSAILHHLEGRGCCDSHSTT